MFVRRGEGYALEGSPVRAWFLGGEVVFGNGINCRMRFAGTAGAVRPEGYSRLSARVSVLIGREPSGWQREIEAYAGVVFREVQPGVDVRYEAGGGRLKSEFIVAPGADPASINLDWSGAENLTIDDQGRLRIRSLGGELVESAPSIYQVTPEGRRSIAGGFRLLPGLGVGFQVDAYDRSQPLIIDPEISYSTFLGGARFDAATAIAVDGSGNTYVAGWTESDDFPAGSQVTGARGNGVDAFVAKLSPSGSLVYSTYIGGSGDDRAFGIAVDGAGAAYVTGWTTSWNFPGVGGMRSWLAGGRDAFLIKLSAGGSGLEFGTFFGGSGYDAGYAVAVSGSTPYVAGETNSSDLPALGAFQSSNAGGFDGFVAMFSPAGNTVIYSTYLGGSGEDAVRGLAVSSSGNAFVTGGTTSLNFPAVSAAQPANAGGQDGFVARLSASGSSLVYSTYLGGGGGSAGFSEEGRAITIDGSGNAYVAGIANSADFPTLKALQAAFRFGGGDAFAAKLGPDGNRLWVTLLGGSGLDGARAIAVTSGGDAFVAGQTLSADFPLMNPMQATLAGQHDVFVSQIDAAGSALRFSTYFGGAASDVAAGIALDPSQRVLIAGQTQSNNLPLVAPFQSVNGGSFGGFVASLDVFPRCSGVGPLGVVTSQTSGTLDLYAYDVKSAKRVYFVTWSAQNGADDIVWYPGANQGGGTWRAAVDLSRHRTGSPDYGPFITHVWMFGASGDTFCSEMSFTRELPPAPSCTGAGPTGVVTSAVSGTLDLYAYGVQNANQVLFPTWSAVNDRDDLFWYPGQPVGGGSWRASIDLSRHRPGTPDFGPFNTHIWMVGNNENTFCSALSFARRQPSAPTCTGVGPAGVVTSATSGTLDLYAYGVQNANQVYFVTWSAVNGSDDAAWYTGLDQGAGAWKGAIDLSRHSPGNPDHGPFIVHVWMFGSGANAFCSDLSFTRN
jgi:hypothetical protein